MIKIKYFVLVLVVFLFGCDTKSKTINVKFSLTEYSSTTDYKLRIAAETTLPDDMELEIYLPDAEDGNLLAQDMKSVKKGKIVFDELSPDGIGLGDGIYKICIEGTPWTQLHSVIKVIGENGENLTGDFIAEDDSRKMFSYVNEMTITNSPIKSLEERRADREKAVAELTSDFKKLYKELLDFKDDAEFHRIGFGGDQGTTDIYREWKKSVEECRDSYEGKEQMVAGLYFSELWLLGMNYMREAGAENDFTKTKRANIDKILNSK